MNLDALTSRIKRTDSGCWIWTGSLTRGGYGHARHAGRYIYLHRFMYETHVGPIPDDFQVDHLCRVRACCNPDHLEPVTQTENIRRAAAAKVACPQGHPYDEDNTYRSPRGERRCRTCARIRKAAA